MNLELAMTEAVDLIPHMRSVMQCEKQLAELKFTWRLIETTARVGASSERGEPRHGCPQPPGCGATITPISRPSRSTFSFMISPTW